MDREINKIEVRLSESESMMYRDDVCDGTCEKKILSMKIRLVVINWHICTKKLRVRYQMKSSQLEESVGM